MRKEQIFLVAALAIGGLLVWGASGKYSEVGASTLPAGTKVSVIDAENPNPVQHLKWTPLAGRSLFAQVRNEKRPALPPIATPAPLPLWWVKLVTTPGPFAAAWRPLRFHLVPVTVPDDPNAAKGPAEEPATEPPKDEPAEDLLNRGRKFDAAKCAKLVGTGGEETLCRLEPSGPLKGQPEWVILEKWPNVQFWLISLNKDGKEFGRRELVGPGDLSNFATVRLSKSLLNEFHEARINGKVRETDREAIVKLATWVFENLQKSSGEDQVPYGLGAVRLAIEWLQKAKAISYDINLARQLGEYCRAAYDLEGDLRAALEYMNAGHAADSAAQVLVGDAYERLGALDAARNLYAKAAQTGDAGARLKIGLIAERMGDLDDAQATLKAIANAPNVAGRALTALARIALKKGNVAEAAGLAEQGRREGPTGALNLVIGAIQYAQGKYADAEKTFAAAVEDERRTEWRSNRGMALLAADKFEDAKSEFFTCTETDPLNLVDPYLGLGDYYQRTGKVQQSNDAFEVALSRAPHHPWTLLRIGTVRLRDGLPEKAVELGLHLLEVAPGCTEGLWLVGRAYAALPTPDYEKSALYLKRAVDKEPDNKDLVNEYVRVLVAAPGRLEEAVKVVEAATDVRSGVGRSDARLLALAAWVRFLAKRPMSDVFETLQRGKVATPDETTKQWLDAVRKTMEDWDRTRVWEEEFDRQASGTIGNGWTLESDQALGVNIGLDGAGHAVFAGTQKSGGQPRESATRLARNEDQGRFKQVEFTVKATLGSEFLCHLFTPGQPLAERGDEGKRRSGGAELGLGCDRAGNMVLWAPKGKNGTPAETILTDEAKAPRPWPMDEFHTVKIVRKDEPGAGGASKGIFEIWLDDERILNPDGGKPTFEIGAFSIQPGKPLALGFLSDADSGAAVAATVDSVRVTKTNK